MSAFAVSVTKVVQRPQALDMVLAVPDHSKELRFLCQLLQYQSRKVRDTGLSTLLSRLDCACRNTCLDVVEVVVEGVAYEGARC